MEQFGKIQDDDLLEFLFDLNQNRSVVENHFDFERLLALA